MKKRQEVKNIVVPRWYNQNNRHNVGSYDNYYGYNNYDDHADVVKMSNKRVKYPYSPYMKRYMTQESDIVSTTVVRKDNYITNRYMHTPYTISEEIFTKFELDQKIATAVAITGGAVFGLCSIIFAYLHFFVL